MRLRGAQYEIAARETFAVASSFNEMAMRWWLHIRHRDECLTRGCSFALIGFLML
jgi:hypothetical protein